MIQHPFLIQSIFHVFELPSTKKTVAYYHAVAELPTKETWTYAIRVGNYDTWPGINVKAVKKQFPGSYETQKGHMKNKSQGHRSTNPKEPKPFPRPYKQINIKYLSNLKTWKRILRSNRQISVLVKQGYEVHHDCIPHRRKLKFLQANAQQNRIPNVKKNEKIIIRMKTAGLGTKNNVLENEIPKEYKAAIKRKWGNP